MISRSLDPEVFYIVESKVSIVVFTITVWVSIPYIGTWGPVESLGVCII